MPPVPRTVSESSPARGSEPATPLAAATGDSVRTVGLDAGHFTLSGLLALPRELPPRAVLVALHGGGMRAGYWHGGADPAASLLTLASACGYATLAVDRPGYGASAARVPRGLPLSEQADRIRDALSAYAARHPVGGGFFLVGHSLGGKAALAAAAGWTGSDLLGVDVSGISDRWVVDPAILDGGRARTQRLIWGPLSLYPPGTFRLAERLVAPVPSVEAGEIPAWPRTYPRLAGHVGVPVRFTFAEYERWWRFDPETLEAMTARLTASPSVRVEHLAGAGHNISLGRAARGYHLRVLAFVEECLAHREASAPRGPAPPGLRD